MRGLCMDGLDQAETGSAFEMMRSIKLGIAVALVGIVWQ